MIRIPKATSVSETTFEGVPWYDIVGIIYLAKSFKDLCMIMPADWEDDDELDGFPKWVQPGPNKPGTLHVPNRLWNKIRACSDKRFVAVPLLLKVYHKDYDTPFAHANMLFYDRNDRTMERFEPYGVKLSKARLADLDEQIETAFKTNIGNDFLMKYYAPMDYCPKIGVRRVFYMGFQTEQEKREETKPGDPKGFCQVWSIWYVHLRLLNPDVERGELIRRAIVILNESDESMTEFIRNYSEFLVKIADEFLESDGDIDVFRTVIKEISSH
jgi:hypothetical protein